MPIGSFEIKDAMGDLLPSQREFIFAPEVYTAIEGGWGSGKTRALCMKGLVLSAAIPGNIGLIGRFNATDLEDSTMQLFWEICPQSWISRYNKTRKVLTFRNNSQILFRHINDPNPKRKHITSTNLGWFGIDQAEECEREHFNTLAGRLRLGRAPKRFGFLAANPNGKDWIYKDFFLPSSAERINNFTTLSRRGDRLGIAVRSEENRKSNGGFVDDDYFIRLRQDMPPDWVAKFLDCSFEDFSGKVYKEYTLDSVHNINAFPIPKHWDTIIGIDVGGDVPWSVGIWRIDEHGNLIRTHEFHKPSVNSREVAHFIKQNCDWQGKVAVIDPENKLAMLELANDHDIHCRPAIKAVRPGIIQQGGYLHVNKHHILPPWYVETQGEATYKKFKENGSPRMFIFNHCNAWRREHDEYKWDDKKPGKVVKLNDHSCDETRYVCMSRPRPAEIREPEAPALTALKTIDDFSYREWKQMEERQQKRKMRRMGLGQFEELSMDGTDSKDDMEMAAFQNQGRHDWD